MNADGSEQTRLTYNGASDVQPAWSLVCTMIAFQSGQDCKVETYMMNADSSSRSVYPVSAVMAASQKLSLRPVEPLTTSPKVRLPSAAM